MKHFISVSIINVSHKKNIQNVHKQTKHELQEGLRKSTKCSEEEEEQQKKNAMKE